MTTTAYQTQTRRTANMVAFLLIVMSFVLVRTASAQDDLLGDPFGAVPDEVAAPTPTADGGTEEVEEPEEETNPTVRAIVEDDPQTPRQLALAISVLSELKRPQLVEQYCERLLSSAPSQEVLADLHRRYGSAFFLRLARNQDSAPVARLGQAVLSAADAEAKSPDRISRLLDSLAADPTRRYSAVVDLAQTGDEGLAAVVNALGATDSSAQLAGILEAVRAMGGRAIPPLMATFDSSSPQVHQRSIQALGELGDVRGLAPLLVPYLAGDSALRETARTALLKMVGELPTREDGVSYLRSATKAQLALATAQRDTLAGETAVWIWDQDQQAVSTQLMPKHLGSLHSASRLARELYRISPEDPDSARLYFSTLLETAQRQVGLDRTLARVPGSVAAQVSELGSGRVEDLLEYSLKMGHTAAAIATIELLGAVGDAELLSSASGQPSVLVSALKHSDRRVRFAAAMAIGNMEPTGPYAGSSYLPKALAYFLRSVGTPRALVVHPRVDRAQTLVGLLAQLGFEADSAVHSSQALIQARRHPDYEFVLLSDAVDRPPVGDFIQQLRRDHHTRHLPVGVMARQMSFEKMERMAATDPLAMTFPRPHDVSALAIASGRLLDRGAQYRVPYEVRVRHAIESLDLWDRLSAAGSRYAFYDLISHQDAIEQLLRSEQFAGRATEILGRFGSASAQRALVAIASRNASELEMRKAAAGAFAVAVRRRGLLLTREEIVLQYDRYNQSAALDRETQLVLGSILDSIESRTRPGGNAGS